MKEKTINSAKAFSKGAVIGGIIGFVFSATTHRKIIFWTTTFAIAGGFIGTKFTEASQKKDIENFKNLDS